MLNATVFTDNPLSCGENNLVLNVIVADIALTSYYDMR